MITSVLKFTKKMIGSFFNVIRVYTDYYLNIK